MYAAANRQHADTRRKNTHWNNTSAIMVGHSWIMSAAWSEPPYSDSKRETERLLWCK